VEVQEEEILLQMGVQEEVVVQEDYYIMKNIM
jgi:hypothetical protein